MNMHAMIPKSLPGIRRYFVFSSLALGVYLSIKVMLIVGQSEEYELWSAENGPAVTTQINDPQSRRGKQQIPLVFPSKRIRECTSEHLGLTPTAVAYCRNASAACRQLLTCRSLLDGSPEALELLQKNVTLAKGFQRSLDNAQLVKATSNCSAYRRLNGFRETTHREAKDFPVAYNILAHDYAHQVARLLRAIYRPNNAYYIHVDAESKPDFRAAMSALAACFDNVRLASRLENITWAGYSRLQADINCMRDHVGSGRDWKYLINTAALAFPLKTVEETVDVLRLYNGVSDVEGIFGPRVQRGRFEHEFVEHRGRVSRTGRENPKPPHNIDVVRGSAYGVFSRAFVEFIVNDGRARDLLEWSRRTWSPDEFYWSTLHHTFANPHLHTPGGYAGYPNDKPWLAVYANWGESPCRGMYVRGVCVFGVGDLPLLLARRELFANKFYANVQPLALDCLEAWIKHKEQCPPPDDLEYYRQLPFIANSQG